MPFTNMIVVVLILLPIASSSTANSKFPRFSTLIQNVAVTTGSAADLQCHASFKRWMFWPVGVVERQIIATSTGVKPGYNLTRSFSNSPSASVSMIPSMSPTLSTPKSISSSTVTSISTLTLTILKTEVEHAGLYACREDLQSEEQARRAQVIVVDPVVRCDFKLFVNSTGNGTAICSVNFTGNWSPVLRWFQLNDGMQEMIPDQAFDNQKDTAPGSRSVMLSSKVSLLNPLLKRDIQNEQSLMEKYWCWTYFSAAEWLSNTNTSATNVPDFRRGCSLDVTWKPLSDTTIGRSAGRTTMGTEFEQQTTEARGYKDHRTHGQSFLTTNADAFVVADASNVIPLNNLFIFIGVVCALIFIFVVGFVIICVVCHQRVKRLAAQRDVLSANSSSPGLTTGYQRMNLHGNTYETLRIMRSQPPLSSSSSSPATVAETTVATAATSTEVVRSVSRYDLCYEDPDYNKFKYDQKRNTYASIPGCDLDIDPDLLSGAATYSYAGAISGSMTRPRLPSPRIKTSEDEDVENSERRLADLKGSEASRDVDSVEFVDHGYLQVPTDTYHSALSTRKMPPVDGGDSGCSITY